MFVARFSVFSENSKPLEKVCYGYQEPELLPHRFMAQSTGHKLTDKEASTVLCSVLKHPGSGRAWKKCRGKHETQFIISPTSWVLYRFLSGLQQNRA